MTDPGALAVTLARPVVRGLLPLDQAEAALAVALLNAPQGSLPGIGTFEERLAIDCHLLRLNIANLENERGRVIAEIERLARPMIRKQPPMTRYVIRSAAHDVNGERGFLLSEAEVEDVLVELVRQDQKPAYQQRPRLYHG